MCSNACFVRDCIVVYDFWNDNFKFVTTVLYNYKNTLSWEKIFVIICNQEAMRIVVVICFFD